MSFRAVCPGCNREYIMPDRRAGVKIRCGKCQAVFVATKAVQERSEASKTRLLQEALAEYRARGQIDLAAWQQRLPDLAADLPGLSAVMGRMMKFQCVARRARRPPTSQYGSSPPSSPA